MTNFRPFDAVADMPVMQQAYQAGSFKKLARDLSEDDFRQVLFEFCQRKYACLIVEDAHRPVAFVAIDHDGWRVEPHVDFFEWASARARFRSSIAFFKMMRSSPEVGVCVVRAIADSVRLFDHLCRREVLRLCGQIPAGDPRGDEWLYYVRGSKA